MFLIDIKRPDHPAVTDPAHYRTDQLIRQSHCVASADIDRLDERSCRLNVPIPEHLKELITGLIIDYVRVAGRNGSKLTQFCRAQA